MSTCTSQEGSKSFFHLIVLLFGKQLRLFHVSGIVLAVTTTTVVPTAMEFPLDGETDFNESYCFNLFYENYDEHKRKA